MWRALSKRLPESSRAVAASGRRDQPGAAGGPLRVDAGAYVEIMIEQVRIILRVDPELEARWRERKLRRLRARLGL